MVWSVHPYVSAVHFCSLWQDKVGHLSLPRPGLLSLSVCLTRFLLKIRHSCGHRVKDRLTFSLDLWFLFFKSVEGSAVAALITPLAFSLLSPFPLCNPSTATPGTAPQKILPANVAMLTPSFSYCLISSTAVLIFLMFIDCVTLCFFNCKRCKINHESHITSQKFEHIILF